jgi:hypothetical protein
MRNILAHDYDGVNIGRVVFQSSLSFLRFTVLFPTTFCLELGKETDTPSEG